LLYAAFYGQRLRGGDDDDNTDDDAAAATAASDQLSVGDDGNNVDDVEVDVDGDDVVNANVNATITTDATITTATSTAAVAAAVAAATTEAVNGVEAAASSRLNVFTIGDGGVSVHSTAVATRAKQIFERMCPSAAFLPVAKAVNDDADADEPDRLAEDLNDLSDDDNVSASN
jgi:hypothetical protein